ncbi:class I SAM-dependent methyltransferase [Novosphingobium sp. CECT 9465]|uniref:class I SAM-dependent methyltransferase n=1 Tax=Novosphingobium sp. CECT 9465 TaxID=2829794 RepID=UPI001E467006|nr:class I SAM-dependent methyltransferase [Novosphingobium sp. CECT 9465]
MVTSPPEIFAPKRRNAIRRRMERLQADSQAPRYIADDMADDVIDRLSFLRHDPKSALLIGDWTGAVGRTLTQTGTAVDRRDPALGASTIDEEAPLTHSIGYDFIASLGTLDTVNDLPGALVHLRRALADGGLMIACFMGAGSLGALRAIMLEADADRPSPRIHPQVDVRAGGQLLQRCGFADPVIDSHHIDVRFSSLDRMIGDLRAQGLGNCLARPGAPLGKAALARARAAFAARADADGKVTERFEILTLSGWAKPLRPPKF